jgi:hypothetical protein
VALTIEKAPEPKRAVVDSTEAKPSDFVPLGMVGMIKAEPKATGNKSKD